MGGEVEYPLDTSATGRYESDEVPLSQNVALNRAEIDTSPFPMRVRWQGERTAVPEPRGHKRQEYEYPWAAITFETKKGFGMPESLANEGAVSVPAPVGMAFSCT
jgi:hypothetical protein